MSLRPRDRARKLGRGEGRGAKSVVQVVDFFLCYAGGHDLPCFITYQSGGLVSWKVGRFMSSTKSVSSSCLVPCVVCWEWWQSVVRHGASLVFLVGT